MSPRYVRNEPGPRENTAAALFSGVFAAGLGIVIFYFARLFMARDVVGEANEVVRPDAGDADE